MSATRVASLSSRSFLMRFSCQTASVLVHLRCEKRLGNHTWKEWCRRQVSGPYQGAHSPRQERSASCLSLHCQIMFQGWLGADQGRSQPHLRVPRRWAGSTPKVHFWAWYGADLHKSCSRWVPSTLPLSCQGFDQCEHQFASLEECLKMICVFMMLIAYLTLTSIV